MRAAILARVVVGVDEATPVTEDYKERHNEFTGKIATVTVELTKWP
jgi:hypothetical protein